MNEVNFWEILDESASRVLEIRAAEDAGKSSSFFYLHFKLLTFRKESALY